MRRRATHLDQRALLVPGEVVIASIHNRREDPWALGKRRPVLLVARHDDVPPPAWSVMGFTTSRAYANGTPRRPIVEALESGLNGPGFLWSEHLTAVNEDDISWHVGFATPILQAQVVDVLGLQPHERDLLLEWLSSAGGDSA